MIWDCYCVEMLLAALDTSSKDHFNAAGKYCMSQQVFCINVQGCCGGQMCFGKENGLHWLNAGCHCATSLIIVGRNVMLSDRTMQGVTATGLSTVVRGYLHRLILALRLGWNSGTRETLIHS